MWCSGGAYRLPWLSVWRFGAYQVRHYVVYACTLTAPRQIMHMDCCGMLHSHLFRESGTVLALKKKASDFVNLYLFRKVFGVRAVSLRYCTYNTSVSLNFSFLRNESYYISTIFRAVPLYSARLGYDEPPGRAFAARESQRLNTTLK